MDKNAYPPTLSVYSLIDMNDYHNLSSSTSPEDNSDLEQFVANTPSQDFVANSGVFISTPGTPSTLHVITPMGYKCESSTESSVIGSSSQCKLLRPRLMQTKWPLTKRRIAGFKEPTCCSLSPEMYIGKNNHPFHLQLLIKSFICSFHNE